MSLLYLTPGKLVLRMILILFLFLASCVWSPGLKKAMKQVSLGP